MESKSNERYSHKDAQIAKNVLESNKYLILHNIVPSDETYDVFVTTKLLPKFVVDGIKILDTQKDKNQKLIDGLLRRNVDLELFCDALQLTGHNMLAEHMRNEVLQKHRIITREDIMQKFPKVEQLLPVAQERERLLSYVVDKFREALVQETWKIENQPDKSATADGKQHLTDSNLMTNALQEKDKTIETMEKKIHELTSLRSGSTAIISNTSSDLLELTSEFDEGKINVKYAQALDSSLIRQNARLKEQEDTLEKLLLRIKEILAEMGIKEDEDDLLIPNVYNKVERALEQFCEKLEEIRQAQRDFEELKQDVKTALNFLHQKGDKNIFYAVRDADTGFKKKEESLQNDMKRLKREIELFEDYKERTEESMKSLSVIKKDSPGTSDETGSKLSQRSRVQNWKTNSKTVPNVGSNRVANIRTKSKTKAVVPAGNPETGAPKFKPHDGLSRMQGYEGEMEKGYESSDNELEFVMQSKYYQGYDDFLKKADAMAPGEAVGVAEPGTYELKPDAPLKNDNPASTTEPNAKTLIPALAQPKKKADIFPTQTKHVKIDDKVASSFPKKMDMDHATPTSPRIGAKKSQPSKNTVRQAVKTTRR